MNPDPVSSASMGACGKGPAAKPGDGVARARGDAGPSQLALKVGFSPTRVGDKVLTSQAQVCVGILSRAGPKR